MGFARGVIREVCLLAVLLVLVVAGSAAAGGRQGLATPLDAVGVALLVAAVAVLPARRQWPRSAFAVVAVIIGCYLLLNYPYGPIFFAASVAVFALAGAGSAGAGVVAVVGALGLWLAAAAPHVVPTDGWSGLARIIASLGLWLVIPAWWALVRARRRDAVAAAAQRRRRELDQQRLELAREVHDVVAHSLTVIGVQAGAGLRVFDRDPDRARDALQTIALTNRQALAELRETIDLLRGPDRDGQPERRAPVGRLADLPALVESARNAGATVDFRPIAPADDDIALGPLVERTAYRIIQESLTNVLRHAPAATVTVRLDCGDGALHLRISDDGPGLRGDPEGRGIAGMRERAEAVGGGLSVTSAGAGGVVVRARLPVAGAR